MQGHISSLLLFLVLFVLPAPTCSENTNLTISRHVSIPELKTWMAALYYCRANYSDFVNFTDAQESSKLETYDGWIALYKTTNNKWKWTTDFDGVSDAEWCTFQNQSNWKTEKCNSNHSYLCMDKRLILVQEVKTWEEALQYCRELHAVAGTSANATQKSDLASLPEANIILLNTQATRLNTTDEVWIGLRFLADEWMWMSGEKVTSSYLPRCPQDQRCGALDQNSTQWKIMKCSEKRNFICSIKV